MKTTFKISIALFSIALLFIQMRIDPDILINSKQKAVGVNEYQQQYYIDKRPIRLDFKQTYTGNNTYNIIKHILYHVKALESKEQNLKLKYQKQSLFCRHYAFEQWYQNRSVYGSRIQVSTDKQGQIILMTDNSYDFKHTLIHEYSLEGLSGRINKLLEQSGMLLENEPYEVWFFDKENEAQNALVYKCYHPETHRYEEQVIDRQGNIIYRKNLNRHLCDTPEPFTTDFKNYSTGTGLVFNPDPLTTANAQYGGEYQNNEDKDNEALNNELVQKTFPLNYHNGLYYLENPFIKLLNLSPPTIKYSPQSTPVFEFTRGDDRFEAVNAFYHITQYQLHLQEMGYDNLVNEQVLVDANANDGADNSFYSNINGNHRILFGTGGVEDAEDADVIIHEYGHAISESACSGCNTGYERIAIDEAICDYYAMSYSNALTGLKDKKIFNWDAHNEFWGGRNLDNILHYPKNLTGDIYERSLIFSGALAAIWDDLGRETSDLLITEALFSLTSGLSMEQAAKIILQMDNVICGGENNLILLQHFCSRGLIEDCNIDLGPDVAICLGDSIITGTGLPAISPSSTVYWTPAINIKNPDKLNSIAYPDFPETYTLHIKDNNTGFEITGSFFVDVKYCFSQDLPESIRLLNTARFMKGRGHLIIEVPENTKQTDITVYDIKGRLVRQYNFEKQERMEVLKDDFPAAGLYIVRIKTDDIQFTEKILKTR